MEVEAAARRGRSLALGGGGGGGGWSGGGSGVRGTGPYRFGPWGLASEPASRPAGEAGGLVPPSLDPAAARRHGASPPDGPVSIPGGETEWLGAPDPGRTQLAREGSGVSHPRRPGRVG